jgi:thiosulfate/3-mercaptopyruvate sulfurtransferase
MDVLVTADWVAEHRTDPHVVLVEVNADATLYDRGHITGAVDWSGRPALARPLRPGRRFSAAMARLLGDSGIDNYSTVVLFGDHGNRFAADACWRLVLCGHPDVRLMDGGRDAWPRAGRALTHAAPNPMRTTYRATGPDARFHVSRGAIGRGGDGGPVIVDVGAEGVPGAPRRDIHVPWTETLREDGTFKPGEALRRLFQTNGISREQPLVTCAAARRESAHTWFVLSRMLGYPDVRNCEDE